MKTRVLGIICLYLICFNLAYAGGKDSGWYISVNQHGFKTSFTKEEVREIVSTKHEGQGIQMGKMLFNPFGGNITGGLDISHLVGRSLKVNCITRITGHCLESNTRVKFDLTVIQVFLDIPVVGGVSVSTSIGLGHMRLWLDGTVQYHDQDYSIVTLPLDFKRSGTGVVYAVGLKYRLPKDSYLGDNFSMELKKMFFSIDKMNQYNIVQLAIIYGFS